MSDTQNGSHADRGLARSVLDVLVRERASLSSSGGTLNDGWMTLPEVGEALGLDRRTMYGHKDVFLRLQAERIVETRDYQGRGAHADSLQYRANARNRQVANMLKGMQDRKNYESLMAEELARLDEVETLVVRAADRACALAPSKRLFMLGPAGLSRMIDRPDAYFDDIVVNEFHLVWDYRHVAVLCATAVTHKALGLSLQISDLARSVDEADEMLRRVGFPPLNVTGTRILSLVETNYDATELVRKGFHVLAEAPVPVITYLAFCWAADEVLFRNGLSFESSEAMLRVSDLIRNHGERVAGHGQGPQSGPLDQNLGRFADNSPVVALPWEVES